MNDWELPGISQHSATVWGAEIALDILSRKKTGGPHRSADYHICLPEAGHEGQGTAHARRSVARDYH